MYSGLSFKKKINGETMRKLSAVLLSVLIVVIVVSCASLKADSVTVDVNGSGTVYLKADMVSFRIQIDETDQTTGLAQQKANKKVSEVLSILRSFNIEDSDITTTSLNFSTDYEWNSELQKSVRTGERVSQSVAVKMHDIDSFGKLVDSLGSSVTGLRLSNVVFDASDHSEALVKARELAYKDAFEKASTYARSAGYSKVVPVRISDSYSNVGTETAVANGLVMAKASSYADASYSTETPSGNLCVVVEAQVQFNIK